MLQPDPSERDARIPIETLFAGFRGGIAPSRYEVALCAYLEKRKSERRMDQRPLAGIAAAFWGMIRRMYQANVSGRLAHRGYGQAHAHPQLASMPVKNARQSDR